MRSQRKQSRVVAFITLGLTLALASVGLAYVAWTDQLTISANVETGTMSVSWMPELLCGDNDGSPGFAQASAIRDSSDHSLMHFSVIGGYPGYVATCHFEWENTGSVPVRISSLDINGIVIASHSNTPFDLDGDGVADLMIRLQNGIGSVEVPGGGGNKSIRIEVLGDAPENTALSFTGHVNFVMWNAP